MSTWLMNIGTNFALAHDDYYNERGSLAKIINRTGATSVKGTLVAASTAYSAAVMLPVTGYDVIGVVYESGIANGSSMWIWLPGSHCRALLVNSTGMSRGQRMAASLTTLGRMTTSTSDTDHARIGFSLQVQSGGTDILGIIAFNVIN